MSWTAEADRIDIVEQTIAPHLPSLEDTLGATVIKRSLGRTVYAVSGLNERDFIVKYHRTRGPFERWKYRVVRSRVAAEWQTARVLDEVGIPVARPFAMGERRSHGTLYESCLITEKVPGAAPLGPSLGGEIQPELKAAILSELARLVRAMHEAGVLHRDLHASNFLLAPAENGYQLILVDLHAARKTDHALIGARVRMLAKLIYTLSDVLSPAERRRFLAQYAGGPWPWLERRIDVAARRLHRIRMRSRTRRCLKESTSFYRARQAGQRIHARREWPPERLGALLQEHEAASGASVITDSKRTRLTHIGNLSVKEFRPRGLGDRLRQLVRRSRARRAWVAANGAWVRGMPTARPLALVEARGGGFLICEWIPEAVPLHEYVVQQFEGRPEAETFRRKCRFLDDLGSFLYRLHQAGVYHEDLSAKNVLVTECGDAAWRFYLIDLVHLCLGACLSRARRIRNLMQINDVPGGLSPWDRLRVFRRYQLAGQTGLVRSDAPVIAQQSRQRHQRWLKKVKGEQSS